ncbi:hypothetical protein ABPG72_009525 [Tetrahymena utriculariae]
MNIKDEKSNLYQQYDPNYLQDSANKHVNLRKNSHKDNIFYDGSPQKIQKDKNHKVSQIEKANDKIKSIIREQKSFSINQSNLLWINSMDLGDLQDEKGQWNSNQISKSKEKIRSILNSKEMHDQHQNQLKNNKSQDPIKLQHNPSYSSKEIRQGDQNPKYQQSINSGVRKSNSIHQSSSTRLDPIFSRQQGSKKQINESYSKFQ